MSGFTRAGWWRSRWVVGLALVLVLVGVVTAMNDLYQKRVQSYRHQAERELSAIVRLQADSVSDWRESRMTDAWSLTDDAFLSAAVGEWLARPAEALGTRLDERLRILQERARYTAVYLLDVDGRVRRATPGAAAGDLPKTEQRALKAALAGAVVVAAEPRRDALFAFPFYSVVAPLFDGLHPVGAIWLVMDVRSSLYPLLQTWPTPSGSAESSIVIERERVPWLLSPLRARGDGVPHDPDKARYPYTQPTDPVMQATEGVRGIFYAQDYRGHAVMSMATAVPESDWLVVGKVDVAEVLQDTQRRELLALSVPVIASLLLLGGAFAAWWWRAWSRERTLKDQLERNMRWLEGVQKSAAMGYFADDLGTGEVHPSRMACDIMGLPFQATLSRADWLVGMTEADRADLLGQQAQAIEARTPLNTQYRTRRVDDQRVRWVEAWIGLEWEAEHGEGPVKRLVGIVQDITERKQVEEELQTYRAMLEDKVMRDPLTQLANRRALNEAVRTEWTRAMRSGAALSVLMVDVDHFKAYNDHHGHVAGDHCLQQVAQAIASAVGRTGELVARYGGEEFSVLLPHTDAELAETVGQRVVDAVRARGLPHGFSEVADIVTVSVGVACVYPVFATDAVTPSPLDATVGHASAQGEGWQGSVGVEALFKQADAALYLAKQAGRDRVVVSRGP